MNNYKAKLEARRETLKGRAERLRVLAAAKHAQAHGMAEAIPFGQPILIGHHSEGRDRRYRARITNNFRASMQLSDQAAQLDARAARVGRGGISSDDPEAIQRLQAKLERLETTQKFMKDANKIIKAKKGTLEEKTPALMALGLTEEQARASFRPDFAGRIGFPDYALQNNNAEIRRVKGRIEQLTKVAADTAALVEATGEAAKVLEFDGFTYREDHDENRIMLEFPGKPAEVIRALLKGHGFRWSPTRKAWVRFLNESGKVSAHQVIEHLKTLQG